MFFQLFSTSEPSQWKSLLNRKFKAENNIKQGKFKVTELLQQNGQSLPHISHAAIDSEVVVAYSSLKWHFWSRDKAIANYEPKSESGIYDLKIHNESLLVAGYGLDLCEKYSGKEIQKYDHKRNAGCALSDRYVVGVFNKVCFELILFKENRILSQSTISILYQHYIRGWLIQQHIHRLFLTRIFLFTPIIKELHVLT